MTILEEGQYVLPDDMTLERTGKYVTVRKKTNCIEGNRCIDYCMDCKYFGHGQATYKGYTTTICLKQPKKRNGLYYYVGTRQFPCANFERKEKNK